MDSILNTIKKLLGIQPEYTNFDEDIIVGINTAFATLNQIGVGPPEGFMIEDETQTWNDYITSTNLVMVKTYIHQKVKLAFDPPNGSVLESLNRSISELEWRLYIEVKENNPQEAIEGESNE